MKTTYSVDVERGMLCTSCDSRRQEHDASVLSLIPDNENSRYGVMIDLGFLRRIIRLIHRSSPVITSKSLLVGHDERLPADLELRTRGDLENLEIWPVVELPKDGLILRSLSIAKLLSKTHIESPWTQISLRMLRPGLQFTDGIHTSIMQNPEIVALIEGADLRYPDPRFISDMNEVLMDRIKRRKPDWFRLNRNVPVLWKGHQCILCKSTVPRLRHIIGTSRIVRCPQCGLEFNNPQAIISPKQLDKYSSRFDHVRGGESSTIRAEQNASIFVDDIDTFSRSLRGQLLLDVGCASGEFLHVLHTKFGWPISHLQGVEPSELSAGDARGKYGLEIHNSVAEALPIPSSTFGLITVLNSIEHFAEPHCVMQRLRHLIKPDGMVFIGTVPNVNSLTSLLFPEGSIDKNFPDGQHHYYFSPETLCRLCTNEGFEVVMLRGRERDIVRHNIAGTARWLAYSCGVRSQVLGQTDVMLRELEERVRQGQDIAYKRGDQYIFRVERSDFETLGSCISFWRREIWSSPYLSDTFDLWLRPRN